MKVKIETAYAARIYNCDIGAHRDLERSDALPLIDGRHVSEVVAAGDDSPLAKLTVEQLKALAAERKIDLGDATRKADIIAAIEQAGEPN